MSPPPGRLDDELRAALDGLESEGCRRSLRDADARGELIDFCSNDYLGLARHADVVGAAAAALEWHGLGGRAARMLGGGGAGEHAALEREAADWQRAGAALLFPTGYHANLGAVTALAGRGDAIVSDALVHASLIDAARLSRAHVAVHRHLDLDDLERSLAAVRGARRRLVLTESVFSMDGDAPDLSAWVAVCRRHRAVLVVDEAHAAGLVGPDGAGAWLARVDARDRDTAECVRVVTCGKALGSAGALVVGSRVLCDWLANAARPFLFTTAAPPAVAAGAKAAIRLCRASSAARDGARAHALRLAERLGQPEPAAAIVPVVVGDGRVAVRVADRLVAGGFDVRAVRPPTVPRGTSRLRLVTHAHNTPQQVDALTAALRDALGELAGAPDPAPASAAAAAIRTRSPGPLFVVGTDTGVGKTVVSAMLLRAAWRAVGARYWKPVQTGDESDTDVVAALSGAPPDALAEPRFRLPLPASPHEAAAAAGVSICSDELERQLAERQARAPAAPWIVELAGGLMVPYGDGRLQIDWLARAAPRVVLVARSGLGTLNHTLLSVEALRRRELRVDALFLVGPQHESNRRTLGELADARRVFELSWLAPLSPAALDAWIDSHDLSWIWTS